MVSCYLASYLGLLPPVETVWTMLLLRFGGTILAVTLAMKLVLQCRARWLLIVRTDASTALS